MIDCGFGNAKFRQLLPKRQRLESSADKWLQPSPAAVAFGLRTATSMDQAFMDELEERTKQFAISVIRLCIKLEKCEGLRRLADQLVDAAGSVAANHRAMRRARSPREFVSKTHVVLEEADECVLWLEIASVFQPKLNNIAAVLTEARELRAIFARAYATARRKLSESKPGRR